MDNVKNGIDRTDDNSSNIENSWIFLSKDGFAPDSRSSIITLKHPRYEKKTKYLISESSKRIYEIQTLNSACRSWLIDETLGRDGNVYACTPIDPLFLVLPRLKEKCVNRAIPLDQLLDSEADPELSALSAFVSGLDRIGVATGPAELNAYKYDEEKTLRWLESKVEKVVGALEREKTSVRPGAVSETFVASGIGEDDANGGDYLKCAFGIVGEYLNEDTRRTLGDRLKIDPEPSGGKRKNDEGVSSEPKRSKTDSVESEYFKEEKIKPVTLSAKEKRRLKAAGGTKNIMSFFSKK